ncbi:putative ribonuclease mrp protein subunit rmp1 [Erysiphe necator]|uniref:Putative ribonuclease mrp protein subunit rmp1 n=1 Tax=Uncinula necator TaxID=52586 RepID=A0A0B1PD32_UNCNE|nr:putative ribonuclease mrp protein subunit rmp1 [Erysiphe necator]
MEGENLLSSIQKLQNISQLLHLAHHRNKNQHRVSRWYKYFGQLRRQISKLILELDTFATAIKVACDVTTTNTSESVTTNKYVLSAKKKIEQRNKFLHKILLPKCYLAFGNLIADNQYAVLGIMLMGLLASVNNILSTLPISNQEEKISDSIEHEKTIDASVIKDNRLDDLGEIVSRQDFNAQFPACIKNGKMGEKSVASKASKKQKKRDLVLESKVEVVKLHSKAKIKKRDTKKDDFFDDIFKNLL